MRAPLPLHAAGALEAAGGSGWGDLPLQREFFLGGARTLRGFRDSSRQGESFWLLRGEAGGHLPGVRVVVFGDVGWVGPRSEFSGSIDDVLASAGIGLSLLDGLFRLDVAKGLRGASATRAYLYLDGLF